MDAGTSGLTAKAAPTVQVGAAGPGQAAWLKSPRPAGTEERGEGTAGGYMTAQAQSNERGIEDLCTGRSAGIRRGGSGASRGGSANSDKQQFCRQMLFKASGFGSGGSQELDMRVRLGSSMAATCVGGHRACMRWACREEQGVEQRRAQEQAAKQLRRYGIRGKEKKRYTAGQGRKGPQSTLGKEGQCLSSGKVGQDRPAMAAGMATVPAAAGAAVCRGPYLAVGVPGGAAGAAWPGLTPQGPSCPAGPAQPPLRRGVPALALRPPALASWQSPPWQRRGCRCGSPCAAGCRGTGHGSAG